jgi:putative two-component system response regulator
MSPVRDPDAFDHTERVAEISQKLAEELGMPARFVRLIRLAAPLHDVGKLHISPEILFKPGKLTPLEFERMKSHTLEGARILADRADPVLEMAEQIALSHHERWDGTGYPHGLKGEEIPVAARIVALADVFDALTHARPYKPAWPVEDAVAEIRRVRGTQFDPNVVDAFERLNPYALVRVEPAQIEQHALASSDILGIAHARAFRDRDAHR